MHLSINQGISGEINLIWDEYEGVPINYYYILRDSTFFNDQWEVIDSVSSNNFIYTDYNVPAYGANYVIEVVPPNGCTATRSVDYSSTRSNRTTYSTGSSAPTAEFTALLTNINQGDAISFIDQSTNSPTSWSWVFEGGSPATSILENPTEIIYNNDGVFDVTLIVINDFGTDTIVKEDFITVNNNTGAPSCAFLASSTQITAGDSINFLDQTQNNPTNWTWVFEGGTPSFSTEQNPSGINYLNQGVYNVTLIAHNGNGSDTLVKTDYINVNTNTGLINTSNLKVNIYPNPADKSVNIDINNYNGEINTKVFDLIGNSILSTDKKSNKS
jgi:PKD repeat protein